MLQIRPDLSPQQLTQIVVWGGLALGLALGVVGQSTRFCVRGAVADWVESRQPGRLVSWLVAIAVGALAVQGLIAAGSFDATRTLAWSDRFGWASYLAGGALFGYGMILAGGCPQRCLVKAGSGNLRSLLTLVLVAISAAMTLRGALAPVRVNLLDSLSLSLGGSQDLGAVLGRALGVAPGALRALLAVLVAVAVGAYGWRVRRQVTRAHWLGGIAVGLLLAAAFYLTGAVGFLPEHPETLEPAWLGTQTHRPEGLSFVSPVAGTLDLLTLWTDKSMVATFGITLSLGVLLGAFVSARLRGDFRLESFQTPRELGAHAAGAVLMGFGGVTALGCSIGNGVTGVALLSSGALLATAGICAGAWLALARRAQRAPALAAAAA